MDETPLLIFYKVVSTKLPAYIYDVIPLVRQSQRHPNTVNFVGPSASKVYNINDPIGIKLVTTFRF